MTRRTGRQNRSRKSRRGLTLIELIVVLALLAALLTFSAPSLSRFFGGRTLEEEGRKMLALTRYGRSEAVSRCVPMELWIDTLSGSYGLAPVTGYGFEDSKAPVEYELAEGLSFAVDPEGLDEAGKGSILFRTDGAIDESSLQVVSILEDDEFKIIEMAQVKYGLGYELQEIHDIAIGER